MQQDIERWNERYAQGNPNPTFQPDPLLVGHRQLLSGGGRALDVACGVGHNALFLASLGYEVVAVDGSLRGLRYCRDVMPQISLSVALAVVDLDRFWPPTNYFDVVVIVRFLDRQLIPRLQAALKRGGLVIYKTFNRNLLLERPDFPSDYVLACGELAGLFGDFRRLATNDSPALQAKESYWIGRKP